VEPEAGKARIVMLRRKLGTLFAPVGSGGSGKHSAHSGVGIIIDSASFLSGVTTRLL
jgi:hypothetical protein